MRTYIHESDTDSPLPSPPLPVPTVSTTGKCTRGKSCPFLHSVGEDPTCSTSADGNNKNKNKNIVKADDTADDKGTPDTDTDTDRCTVKSKPKATTKVKVKVKPSAAVVDGKRGDNGAPTVTTVTAAKRSAPDEAAAGAAQAADGGPPIKPRRLGSSSFLSLSSKARFVGGAVKAAASAGESAGSWAGIVKSECDKKTSNHASLDSVGILDLVYIYTTRYVDRQQDFLQEDPQYFSAALGGAVRPIREKQRQQIGKGLTD